jgi:hypothetical protein
MRRLLLQDQNNGKALEVRLEVEGDASFYVVIAGLTINLRSGCIRGICEPTGENEYLAIENETYSCQSFADYNTAKEMYDGYKARYLD